MDDRMRLASDGCVRIDSLTDVKVHRRVAARLLCLAGQASRRWAASSAVPGQ